MIFLVDLCKGLHVYILNFDYQHWIDWHDIKNGGNTSEKMTNYNHCDDIITASKNRGNKKSIENYLTRIFVVDEDSDELDKNLKMFNNIAKNHSEHRNVVNKIYRGDKKNRLGFDDIFFDNVVLATNKNIKENMLITKYRTIGDNPQIDFQIHLEESKEYIAIDELCASHFYESHDINQHYYKEFISDLLSIYKTFFSIEIDNKTVNFAQLHSTNIEKNQKYIDELVVKLKDKKLEIEKFIAIMNEIVGQNSYLNLEAIKKMHVTIKDNLNI